MSNLFLSINSLSMIFMLTTQNSSNWFEMRKFINVNAHINIVFFLEKSAWHNVRICKKG